ncbi:MAG: sugar ABC transporter substrate-binding protein [Acidimicrobiia bacterium]|nr:sugar ABC transporter substrate-binding protein [Acidimicrobiia bacterium]MDH4307634.1 sugar ABC transporter substrate-binding protein [Acidimicrobiia bacterium]MDH5294793.1 sugar ABC transporter substrate-binding protein [Acidimicrobiia bacterium]
MRKRVWLSLLAVLALVLAACTSVDESVDTTGGGDEPATTQAGGDDTTETSGADTTETSEDGAVAQRDYRFVVVSHGQSSDPFWSVAANGVQAAADDMGVTVEYQAPGTFDMVEMSQIIDAAVASQPDGLVVTLPDPEALGASVEAAVAAGIPVISMNSGSDAFADLGVLVHVGQTEYEAGLIAGQRMAAEGVTNALCINQEVGNVALDQRCQGFTDGLGGTVEVVPVDLADPAGTQSSVEGAISANPDVNGILALGPTGAIPTLAAVDSVGADVALATFDLGPEVLQAIIDGQMLFAIDQAQYLQGYLPIVLLTKFLDTGALPLGSVDRVILTGPQIVTADTAADVIGFSEQGLR